MVRDSIDDLEALFAVAREGSFTRAAGKLGVSQSALSQTVRSVEARLGLRLLTRTTRSVAPTEAGERLMDAVVPRLEEIRAALAAVKSLRDTPSGTIRLNASDHAAETVLMPIIRPFLARHPHVAIELDVDNGFTDIVAHRFDAGIRLGEVVDKDMVSLPVGGDQRLLVVGSPALIERCGIPDHPRELAGQPCLNLRLQTLGSDYAWEFERDGRELKVRVSGQFTCNTAAMLIDGALAGLGYAYLPEDQCRPHVVAGRLITVLEDWSPSYPGYQVYYPSRRQHSLAFQLFINHLQDRIGSTE